MNNCYTSKNENINQMYEEYGALVTSRVDRFLDRLFAFFAALLGFCRRREVRRVLRYATVAICFFCFLGLVGGIEQELISVGLGVVSGLLLIFVEILCLK
ncbi:MAG: hypothetical protein IJW97_07655 [Clostridia bacterium]|nr:hypothetical protein [Clostridia bacterium]